MLCIILLLVHKIFVKSVTEPFYDNGAKLYYLRGLKSRL